MTNQYSTKEDRDPISQAPLAVAGLSNRLIPIIGDGERAAITPRFTPRCRASGHSRYRHFEPICTPPTTPSVDNDAIGPLVAVRNWIPIVSLPFESGSTMVINSDGHAIAFQVLSDDPLQHGALVRHFRDELQRTIAILDEHIRGHRQAMLRHTQACVRERRHACLAVGASVTGLLGSIPLPTEGAIPFIMASIWLACWCVSKRRCCSSSTDHRAATLPPLDDMECVLEALTDHVKGAPSLRCIVRDLERAAVILSDGVRHTTPHQATSLAADPRVAAP